MADIAPGLDRLAVAVAAPEVLLTEPDGRLRGDGVQGWYVDDVRLLRRLETRVSPAGSARAQVGHTLSPDGLVTTVEVIADRPVTVDLEITLAVDLAPVAVVRQQQSTEDAASLPTTEGLSWTGEASGCALSCTPAPASYERLGWRFDVSPDAPARVDLRFAARGDPQFAPGGPPPWSTAVPVPVDDPRWTPLVRQGLADLAGLLLRDGEDAFVAAGAPWYLTMFGRDALWTARLMMPFGTGLALSTLRALARRQGVSDDPSTEEQPGKILHEVRSGTVRLGGMVLPPVYYGTVDATPLFVGTLADAWRAGADRDEVAALVPAARRCLEWMMSQTRESGWLRYVDSSGHGLANQGWKDSVDSVRYADGGIAEPPIALCEVQGYAYEAAVQGAALLAELGEPPVEGLAAWAASLRRRFAEAFWVDTPEGGHVAIALDGRGRPADAVASNMGHLLGTGILTPQQARRVATVLTGPAMSSGYGLRTLALDSPAYDPLSYHCGSVWPHDTAIAVRGLVAESFRTEAAGLARGLVEASGVFGARLPELWSGDPRVPGEEGPAAYPSACRPQAWAAAAPLACLAALAG
ncbi:amylo-alpha-1,6-glucosidase [Nocardioides guangzhouensis]|uniref:Amylo-alpha-1,6-glucosidase n=1 Tax=Nocardioides guangzhouensis TaxID=2497878 RepID=A0A4Q4ZBJ2_9ACTN|nr:amylo-alpha-1,6-glucosidase [Nocardioides guangzhouensis]RYP84955.1 amylo-alpha-1,6-glucosidase [Nocardioides guangzhouensis]